MDTNIVIRRVGSNDPLTAVARAATERLNQQGHLLFITPQNLIEFRAVATRPPTANGLGLAAEEATLQARAVQEIFPLLPDVPAIYDHWRRLMDRYAIVGRQVYDARLVAVMLAHRIPRSRKETNSGNGETSSTSSP